MEWIGFWLFMAVFVAVDYWVYTRGHDTFWLKHKTPEEKELQQLATEERRLRVELLRVELTRKRCEEVLK